ncbi:hypothetical protein EK21DRAFT_91086 [Setomelanomma holmii]|uniref:Uncharacterized protein n=1 Tax=Setomelanomma holmii TaxID=210430 RepID=A0A9P4H4D9_9PLEO|nr:hypothetical protein EK21DRAFT_91086 [Setomelanomma holmii]
MDSQAAIATAVLVSLLLESRRGLHAYHLASLSPMRSGSGTPWSFAGFLFQDSWRSAKFLKRCYGYVVAAIVLLITTTMLKFSSTFLQSNLNPAPLVVALRNANQKWYFLQKYKPENNARNSAWTSNSSFYPTFGEFSTTPPAAARISDTVCETIPVKLLFWARGCLARRQMTQASKAMDITQRSPSLGARMDHRHDRTLISSGGLMSTLRIRQVLEPHSLYAFRPGMRPSSTSVPRVRQIVPSRQCSGGDYSKTNGVISHLIPRRDYVNRQILQMEKPTSLLGDPLPRHERPLLQSDATGSSAAKYGSNTPFPGNWSIFLTGEPYTTLLSSFSRPLSQAIAADPAWAATFSDKIGAIGSVAWAMSNLVTVLSAMNYYSQLPAFDRIYQVIVSYYVDVLYPQSRLGFTILLWSVVAHCLVVTLLLALFINSTKLTLLGSSWSGFSQMAESRDVRAHFKETSLIDDYAVLKELRARGDAEIRARVVKRGNTAAIAIG